MNSELTAEFIKLFRQLPNHIQKNGKEKLSLVETKSSTSQRSVDSGYTKT
jgi:hypothetical protein